MIALIVVGVLWIALEIWMLFKPDRKREWVRFIYAGLPGWMEAPDTPEKLAAMGEEWAPLVAGPATLAMKIAYNGHIFVYRGPWIWGLLGWLWCEEL